LRVFQHQGRLAAGDQHAQRVDAGAAYGLEVVETLGQQPFIGIGRARQQHAAERARLLQAVQAHGVVGAHMKKVCEV
jgi:hypothetical protein